MKLFVTGGAGFIGSNLVIYMLQQHTKYLIVNVDALTYAGKLEILKFIENHINYTFVKAVGNNECTNLEIVKTIQWYLNNKEWMTHIQSSEYQQYQKTQYGERLGDSL